MKAEITHELLTSVLHYDKNTGIFTWIKHRHRARVGSSAGCINGKGYVVIRANLKLYLAHRLAWFYVFRRFPSNQIDHINEIKIDNRICNLREVSASENKQNTYNPYVTNKLKIMGVYPRGKSFVSRIRVNGKKIYLGSFPTPEEAHQVYLKAKKKYHIGKHES